MAIVYVNGAYVPENEAKISIFDRSFLMGDSIYEVSAVIDGRLIDNKRHLARLERSLGEIHMKNPLSQTEWTAIAENLIQKNQLKTGLVYWQISRGVGPRDFIIHEDMQPTVIAFTQAKEIEAPKGWKITICPDQRWRRRDIKTTQLLYQSLAKTNAKRRGFDDCWFEEDGFITEGSSCNAWIIKGNRAITRPASHAILNGITKTSQSELLGEVGLEFEERPFRLEEALGADEAFITSATTFAQPVISIDSHSIGDGQMGKKTLALRQLYIDRARAGAF